METVMKIFTEITTEINKKDVYPIIYGSLGLYLKLKKNGVVNDIDFIINKPEEFSVCKEVLIKNGFKIDPDHERELIRDNFYVSFIDKTDIEKLIDEPLKLDEVVLNNTKFFNIDISQYLKIYKVGLKNKDRKERKEKDDLEKIKEIEMYLMHSY